MQRKLVSLKLRHAARATGGVRAVFGSDSVQRDFQRDGFVKLSLLDNAEVLRLTELFVESTGGTVRNSEYGMYIGLEELDLEVKRDIIRRVSAVVLPKANRHFLDCKPHLGSFLVKAPGAGGYTYPHQDWTFVDSPPYTSMTIWIALVDTDEHNGALGFVRGSHRFFDKPVGSPSPEFRTCTQGHEAILYEYLEFVPLDAGEAIVFDNRTIHGAAPNTTEVPRTAVAIGMTPCEAQLYHHFLVPGRSGRRRAIAKLKVDEGFFERHTMASLRNSYLGNRMPDHAEVAAILDDEFIPCTGDEIRQMCEQSGLVRNGLRLEPASATGDGDHLSARSGVVRRAWNALRAMRS
jgi:Phytanoyl-CoA dioxygenase (PhyH)